MKITLIFSVIVLASSLFISSCKLTPQEKSGGSYTFETSCLGVEMDGSHTVQAWGDGRNRTDAIEQAKKNAVRDILFKGIRNGKPDCQMKPVVPEVNAQEKYEEYFNKFFADGGPYKQFISKKDGNDWHIEVIESRLKSGSQAKYRVTIRVMRSELKAKMIEDKILTQ